MLQVRREASPARVPMYSRHEKKGLCECRLFTAKSHCAAQAHGERVQELQACATQ